MKTVLCYYLEIEGIEVLCGLTSERQFNKCCLDKRNEFGRSPICEAKNLQLMLLLYLYTLKRYDKTIPYS